MSEFRLDPEALLVETADLTPQTGSQLEAAHTDFFSFPCCPTTSNVYLGASAL
jgi:hypothetical protein